MLSFLQQNAEWMCAIAIVIFTFVQILIAYAQFKQELRFRRFDLAHQMDEACVIYKFDKESVHKVVDWFNRNASNFMYLLNEKDLIKYDQFFNYLQFLYGKNIPFDTAIKDYRKYLVELDVVLMNATYGLRKLRKYKRNIQEKVLCI